MARNLTMNRTRHITLASGKLTDEEASWLRDWLAHHIGELGRPAA